MSNFIIEGIDEFANNYDSIANLFDNSCDFDSITVHIQVLVWRYSSDSYLEGEDIFIEYIFIQVLMTLKLVIPTGNANIRCVIDVDTNIAFLLHLLLWYL